jgi:hypothetical protein
MSIQRTPQNEGGSHTRSAATQTSLNTANVTAHERHRAMAQESGFKLRRWLADTSDSHHQAREAHDWKELVEKDDVAAAIESATCHGGGAAPKRGN